MAYLDESGISNRDPFVVVGGVVVHCDTQLEPAERHLVELIDKHIPEKHRAGFVFHATDIYAGGDKKCIFHDKAEWPDERRWAILDDLVVLPAKLKLPICFGAIARSYFEEVWPDRAPNLQKLAIHGMAIACCEAAVDTWMKRNTVDEVAFVTMENNDDVRKFAKHNHNIFKDPDVQKKFGFNAEHPYFSTNQDQRWPAIRVQRRLEVTAIGGCLFLGISKASQKRARCETIFRSCAKGSPPRGEITSSPNNNSVAFSSLTNRPFRVGLGHGNVFERAIKILWVLGRCRLRRHVQQARGVVADHAVDVGS